MYSVIERSDVQWVEYFFVDIWALRAKKTRRNKLPKDLGLKGPMDLLLGSIQPELQFMLGLQVEKCFGIRATGYGPREPEIPRHSFSGNPDRPAWINAVPLNVFLLSYPQLEPVVLSRVGCESSPENFGKNQINLITLLATQTTRNLFYIERCERPKKCTERLLYSYILHYLEIRAYLQNLKGRLPAPIRQVQQETSFCCSIHHYNKVPRQIIYMKSDCLISWRPSAFKEYTLNVGTKQAPGSCVII